jgi:membrane protein implicated in regulation of membrane protease activity
VKGLRELSKTKAMWLSAVCVGLNLLFTYWLQFPAFIASLLLWLVFTYIWLTKRSRDKQFIAEAEAELSKAALAEPAAPLMNSPESRHLFVPPSLSR